MALVGHWKLDGDVTDSSGYSNDASTSSITYGTGKLGQARTAGSATVLSDPIFNVKGPLSVSFWFKPNSNTTRRTVLQTAYAGSFCINHETAGDLRFYNGNNTSYDSLDSSVLTNGVWYHCVITRDESNNRIWYLNGDEDRSDTTNYSGGTRQDNLILASGYTNDTDGTLDDVRIYNHVLSQKEIKELSKAKVLHYKMDDFQEPTENVVTNTDLNTGWSKGYQTNIVFDEILPPIGIDSPTVGHDRGNSSGYWYSYGDYAPQVPNTTYAVSLYVKTLDPNFSIKFYTADNSEAGRYNSEYISVPNDGGWHRVKWAPFLNPATSASDSLSFNFTYGNAVGDPQTRTWFCAPQMEAKDHHTPFVDGIREGTVIDSSSQGNDAPLTLSSTPKWVKDSKLGSGAYSFDGTQYVECTDNDFFALDQISVFAWAKPKGDVGSQNIVTKRPSNEGWIIHNASTNALRCYVHTNGSWKSATTANVYNSGQWVHVGFTYDGTTLQNWVNGEPRDSVACTGNITATPGPISVGAGNYTGTYAQFWDGEIDDVRVYATALSDEDIQELYQTRASLDNSGVFYTHYINEAKHSPLLMDYTVWEDGQSGSVGSFGRYSNGNSREIATDPFGVDTVVWKSSTQDPPNATYPSQGGIYHSTQTIDNTKMYRASWWEKRVTNNGATYGRYYAGCNGYSSPVLNRSNGSPNGNPYFTSWNHSSFQEGEWLLVVGHIWPAGSGTGSMHPDSHVYRTDGSIFTNTSDFVFDSGTTSFRTRTLAIYRGDVAGMVHYTAYPRLDVVDGTEPSIAELLSGHDSRKIEYVRTKGGTSNISLDITDQKTNLGTLSEIGPANGLVAWYPLSGYVKDYAASNDGTLSGATPTERGYLFDTTTESVEVPNPLSAGEPHTVSMWIKPSAVLPDSTSSGSRKTPFTGDGPVWSPGIWLTRRVIRVHAATEYRDYTIDYNTTDWWHIGQIFDGTTCYTIINGEIVLGTRTGYSPVNPTTFRIGNESSSSSASWDGFISDVRIYNRALQSEEISILYNITNPANTTKMEQSNNTLFVKKEFKETY